MKTSANKLLFWDLFFISYFVNKQLYFVNFAGPDESGSEKFAGSLK